MEKTKEIGPRALAARVPGSRPSGRSVAPRMAPLPAFASFDRKFSPKTGSSLAEVGVDGPELPGFSIYTYACVYIYV